jgi:hypothetical protein
MSQRVLAIVAAAVIVFATGCGSSSKSNSAAHSTSAAPAGGTSAASGGGQCPFSGSTAAQSQPGSTNGTQLTNVKPTVSGCIDNITFAFSPTLAASHTAYQSGSTTVLVVELQGAKLGSGITAGPVNTHGLNYVNAVQVSAPSGAVDVAITLNQQQQFLVSTSQVPPQLQLAIG